MNIMHICEYCDKHLSRKDALIRHYKSCKDKKAIEESGSGKLLQSMLNRIKLLEIENKKLATAVGNIQQQNITNINGNNNIVTNINITVGLNEYGVLDYEDLSPFGEQIKTSFINNIKTHVSTMLKLIHKNPDLPQYQNVHLDGTVLLVYLKDQGWSEKDAIEFINEFTTVITRPGMLQYYSSGVETQKSRDIYDENLQYLKCHKNPLLLNTLK